MAPADPPGTAVATVAGRPITVADVDRRVAAIHQSPAGDRLPAANAPEGRRTRRWVAQLLVTEAVITHEAEMAGIHAASASCAARELYNRVTADVAVPESDVRAYYESNASRYRRPEGRRVRHVLLDDEPTARRIARRVAAGEDMAGVAGAVSQDRGTRHRGGDLGELRRGQFVGPFEDAVFAAAVDEVLGPVRTEFGWHVIRVEAVRPAGHLPYADARVGIAADLLAVARGQAFDGWLEQRSARLADLAPAWLHPGDPRLPDSVHRH